MTTRYSRLFVLCMSLLLLILSLVASGVPARAADPSLADAMQAALDAARAAGSYRLVAEVQQHIVPQAVPENWGKSGTSVTMALEGEVVSPDEARLQWDVVAGTTQDAARVEVLLAGSEAYIGHDGRWAPVQDPLGMAAPVADSLSLLDAIDQVERLPDAETAGGNYARYRFAIDGRRYSELMRARTERHLQQDLALDVRVGADLSYWNVEGMGELWVGADGLPQRLVFDMSLPGVAAGYDSQVQMRIDYSDFGAPIAPIQSPPEDPGITPIGSSAGLGHTVGAGSGAVLGQIMQVIAPFVLVALLSVAILLVLQRKRRRLVYASVASACIASMVIGMPLQALAMANTFRKLSERPSLSQALATLGLPSVSSQQTGQVVNQGTHRALAPATSQIVDCLTLPSGIQAADDYDGDQISNGAEHCFGTSYTDADTDGDTISDSEELQGFVLGGKTWTTDPLQPDSNLDGIGDAAEWSPNWVANQSNTLDLDGDGVPNPWDDDNDGDGVPDGIDISPYKVLGYQSDYDLTVTKPANTLHQDTYVYIDILAQPQDASHLRYYTTPLDWPYDSQAQIRDLDGSKDDVKLIPMLELKSTTKPSLTSEYGLIVQDGATASDPFRILLPVTPIGEWGSTDAFKARIAFTPNESASGIQLTDMRLGWLVQVKNDTQHRTFNRRTGQWATTVTSADEVAVSYYESSFRLAGLSITESEDVQVALFGAPNAPETAGAGAYDEGFEMANLVTNLALRFLYNTSPDLQTVTTALSQPGNAIYTDWHIQSTLAASRKSFTHRDAALVSTTSTDTGQFLDSHYSTSRSPLLVMGYQETAGSLGLEASGSVTVSGNHVTAALSGNTLATLRQVQLTQYHRSGSQWKAMSMDETVSALRTRYASQGLATFEQSVERLYLTYYGGMVNYVAKNGTSVVGASPSEQAIVDLTNHPTKTTLPGYVNATYQLDFLADLSDAQGDIQALYSWQDSVLASGASELQGVVDFTMQVTSRALDSKVIREGVEWIPRVSPSSVQSITGSSALAGNPLSNAAGQRQLVETTLWTAGIAPIVETVGMWSAYSSHKGDVSAMQSDMELATAIAATIVAVVVFLLAAPLALGGLLAAFVAAALLDALGITINFQGVFNDIVKWLTGVISDFSLYSKLKDDNPVTSSAISMEVSQPAEGLVTGNGFTLGITYTTAIVKGPGKSRWNWTHSRSGEVGDVNSSTAYGQWQWNSATASVSHDTPTYSPIDCSTATDSHPQRNCRSKTTVTITPQEAVRNLGIALTTILHYKLRYQACWGVSFIYDYCTARDTSGTAPSSSDSDAWNNATSTIYFDIFPDSVGGLWIWSEITNRDPDGDGMSDGSEDRWALSSSKWDTDGDRLSDLYEVRHRSTLHTRGWSRDTDSDGLSDLQELLIGTAPAVADTDKDGLKDGQEVCHLNHAGNLAGGWNVTTLDNAFTYRVCSNPLEADADNDTMSDSQEKKAGTSPYQPNTAPQLVQTVISPLYARSGISLTVLGGGQNLEQQFNLTSDLGNPITDVLSWCVPPGEFGTLTVTGSSSNGTFTMPTPTSGSVNGQDCTQWDLSSNALHTGEQVTVTLQVPALAAGASGPISQTLTLPYIDPVDNQAKQVQQSLALIVDTDTPTSTVTAPVADEIINGTSILLGGGAHDQTSWVSRVEVSTDGGSSWQTATGTDAWSQLWTLPSDGTYTLLSRATDIAGNVETSPNSIQVTVDNTAPGASITNLVDGQVITGITPNTQGGASILIQGSATDLLSGAPLASGVVAVQMAIDGGNWQTVWPVGRFRPSEPATWSHTWEVNADATGDHTLSVRAIDALGHVGNSASIDVIVDVLPPLVELDSPPAQAPGNTTITLQGFVDDNGSLPAPFHPVELTGTVDSEDDATVWLEPDSVGQLAGATVTWIGDFNADGLGDAAIGLPNSANSGQVSILYGARGGWPELPDVQALAASPSSLVASDTTGLGRYLAPAGDVNGDGHYDLLIGDPGNNRVFVVFGRVGATGPDWELNNLDQLGQSAYGYVVTASSGTVGQWIASAGDVNDDGYGDVLIGTSTAVYLLVGRRRAPSQTIDVVTDATAVLPFDSANGAVAIGVGDMTGDAFGDFVISDPWNSLGGGRQIYLFQGSSAYRTPSNLFPQQILDPIVDADASFGWGVATPSSNLAALGDINGDTLDDFMYQGGDGPHLVLGRLGGGWNSGYAGYLFPSYSPVGNGFIAAPGDVNADGYADVVIGNAAGDAYLVHGTASIGIGSPPTAAATILDVGAIASTPYARGADLNGDLSSDLLVLPSGIGGSTDSTASTSLFDPARYDATVDDDYCSTCQNDGLAWQVTAFDSIQDAVDATSAALVQALGSGEAPVQTIGIAAGSYNEDISLPSHIHLEGAGAAAVLLTGSGAGSVITIDSATDVQVSGLTVTGAGSGTADAGVSAINASNYVTLTRNIIRNNSNGIIFASAASGNVINNTLVNNTSDTIRSENAHTWIGVTNNILYNPGNGLHSVDTGVIINDYNYYSSIWSTAHVQDSEVNLRYRPHERINVNPRFVYIGGHDYRLYVGSPAVDKANSLAPVPAGGGIRGDLGYAEQIATPVTLLFGKAGIRADSPYRLAHWRLDEGGGPTAYDATGNRQDATIHGNPVVVTGVPAALAGFSTHAVDLDGIDDYLVVPDDDTFDFGADDDFSVAFWVKPDPVQVDTQFGDNDIVEKWSQHVGAYPFVIRYLNQNDIRPGKIFAARYDGSHFPEVISNTRIDDNQFHHIAFVKNGGTLYLYVDGVLDATTPDTTTGVTANASGLFIGRRGTGSNRFKGTVDDLLIYNKALNAQEIASLADGTAAASEKTSGVSSAEVGLSYVADASTPLTATVPGAWANAILTTAGESESYWSADVTPGPNDGLYRIYTRGADLSGNQADPQFAGSFLVDSATPAVTLTVNTTTTAPALTLQMDVADWAPTGISGESAYNVDQAYFTVDGTAVTATPSAATAVQGQAQRYHAQVGLSAGSHTVIAHAVDRAGNSGQSATAQVTVQISSNEATLTDPAPGSAISSGTVDLSGFVHFVDTSGNGQVEVLVDGVSQGMATLSDVAAQATTWVKAITLAGDGQHAITLRASRSAGSSTSADSVTSLILDTGVPTLTITSPAAGTAFNQDFTITGSASDGGSGLVTLETSDDGGYSWVARPLNPGGSFSIDWSIPELQDYISYPILVRAGDWAGNTFTQTVQVIIDSVGPTFYRPVTIWPDEGSHTTTYDPYALGFSPPLDGGGVPSVLMEVTPFTDTVPTTPIIPNFPGGEAAWPGAGTWYIHLLFEDGVGNQDARTLGPFYVEEYTGTLASTQGTELSNGFRQSIIVDGHMDIDQGEWNPRTERLDVDPRFSQAHALYAAWDDSDLFLGWRGALWSLHGDAWFYLDTKPGGTSQAYHAASLTLPMEADYAIEINSSTEGRVWRFDDNWQEIHHDRFEFAHRAGSDTEIRAPRAAIDLDEGLGLLAFVYDERSGRVMSAFPTTNPISTCQVAGHCPQWQDVYRWASLSPSIVPNAGQPQGHHARVAMSSPQGLELGWGPAEALQYVIRVHNLDHLSLTDTALILDASQGLTLESLDRDVPVSPEGDRWFVDVGELAMDETRTFTLTARLQDDLTAIDYVTVTAELDMPRLASEPVLAFDRYRHRVDSVPPVVQIDLPGSALPPGLQGVRGTADDADGGGVDRVEVRVDGGPWILASGQHAWQAQVDLPGSGTATIEARATDVHGYESQVVSTVVMVDSSLPTADLDLDNTLLSGLVAHLTGIAGDGSGSGVAAVQISIDGGHWVQATLPLQAMGGSEVAWRHSWTLPREDGAEHTFAVRAVDRAGNIGQASVPVVVTVDSLAPTSTILVPQAGDVISGSQVAVSGTAVDGHGIGMVEVSIDGGATWTVATITGVPEGSVPADMVSWQVSLPLPDPAPDTLVITSRATDLAGNVERRGAPLRVAVQPETPMHRLWLPSIVK